MHTHDTCTFHALARTATLTVLQKYNPDLQKRALATREQRQQEFDGFVMQLREASKSDKPSMSPYLFLEIGRTLT
jgi:hypothetical protein